MGFLVRSIRIETLPIISIMLSYIFIISTMFLLFFLVYIARNWNVIRILPSLILNLDNFHHKVAEIITNCNGTVLIKSAHALIVDRDMLLTSDPVNINHIMNKNFRNYPKGSGWRQRFDVFGKSVFNTDAEEWSDQRKVVRTYICHSNFQPFIGKILRESVEKELIPVLENAASEGLIIDLKKVISGSLAFIAHSISAGYDPKTITASVSLPEDAFTNALDNATEAILVRHIVPETIWKIQRWLGVGMEKIYKDAVATIDLIIELYMSKKNEELRNGTISDDDFSALRHQMEGHAPILGGRTVPRQRMRDNIISLILASEDTSKLGLLWFFWLLSRNPDVETKIRKEIEEVLQVREAKRVPPFSQGELSKLVYLHAALYETLRLYPPAPYHSRTALTPDKLPTGHKIRKNTNVLISVFATARMSSVWGPDCCEFKPERWIMEDGRIKHEPSHKFLAFSTGPRICIGKELGFTILKTFAAMIIPNYQIQVMEDHPVMPKASIVLSLKHGLKVRVKKLVS